MLNPTFTGMIVPIVTPFNEDYHLDEVQLNSVINFLISQKVHGIYVCDTTGEFVSLSFKERKKI